jgi:hypothetical protein
MKRPFQISLLSIFGAVFVAAVLAWIGRESTYLAVSLRHASWVRFGLAD